MASRPGARRIANLKQRAAAIVAGAVPILRQSRSRVEAGVRAHPHLSAIAAGLVALGLLLGVVRLPAPASDTPEVAVVETIPLPVAPLGAAEPRPESAEPDVVVTVAGIDLAETNGSYPAEVDRRWQTVTVAPGETLERIFRRLDLTPGLLHQVVHLDDHTRGLARIRPGDTFDFDICPENGFQALRASLDEENWLLVERNGDGLASRLEGRALEVRRVEATAEITSSLFNAGKGAGLSDAMIMHLASIFGWDVDFALDIRRGDRFALIYEEVYRDGERLRDGNIVAARFTNRGRTFEAIRFETEDGADYYAPDGRPMRKAFLRAPLNFTRVTSGFNPRRFHPITRQTRPHNGIDYGAATGTPVWASGDGRVLESAYNRANGNYVFIQHGNNIVTKYLHLSKRHVNRGDRVRQGQTIGLVGATGLATGPHLHYEFIVDGVHRNPGTVELPNAEPLPEHYLADFRLIAQPLLASLKQHEQGDLILAEGPEGERTRH